MADSPLRQFDRGRTIRSQSVAVSLLRLIEKAVKGMRRDMVMSHQRWDEVLVHYACSQFALAYSAVTSFVWAHGFFLVPFCFVWGRTLNQRKCCCLGCRDAKADDLGIVRCFGYQGGTSCRCPQKWWWFPGFLSWMQILRNRVCPRGFFGRFFKRGASHGD